MIEAAAVRRFRRSPSFFRTDRARPSPDFLYQGIINIISPNVVKFIAEFFLASL